MKDKYYSETFILTILVHISRWAVGILFVAAAVPKILNPETFMRTVANYNLLPLFLVPLAAIVLPWLELFCGACLLTGKFVRSAASILTFLIIVFIFGIGINYFRGADFECGCFGLLFNNDVIGISAILRDFLILGLISIVLFFSGKMNYSVEK